MLMSSLDPVVKLLVLAVETKKWWMKGGECNEVCGQQEGLALYSVPWDCCMEQELVPNEGWASRAGAHM